MEVICTRGITLLCSCGRHKLCEYTPSLVAPMNSSMALGSDVISRQNRNMSAEVIVFWNNHTQHCKSMIMKRQQFCSHSLLSCSTAVGPWLLAVEFDYVMRTGFSFSSNSSGHEAVTLCPQLAFLLASFESLLGVLISSPLHWVMLSASSLQMVWWHFFKRLACTFLTNQTLTQCIGYWT